MREVLQDFVREEDYRRWVDATGSSPTWDERLDAVSRLRAEHPLFISETTGLLLPEPPLRIFACPHSPPVGFPEGDLGIFLVLYRSGAVCILYWSEEKKEPGKTKLTCSPDVSWPKPESFPEQLAESLSVVWHSFSSPYPKLEVHLAYSQDLGECITVRCDPQVLSGEFFRPAAQNTPAVLFSHPAQTDRWPCGSMLQISGSEQWLYQPRAKAKRTSFEVVLIARQGEGDSPVHLELTGKSESVGRILAAAFDADGALWAATSDLRLLRWPSLRPNEAGERKGETLTAPLPLEPTGLLQIRTSGDMPQDYLLLTTQDRGLHLLDPSQGFAEGDRALPLNALFVESVYLPGTIQQVHSARKRPDQVLLLLAHGRLAAVRFRSRQEIRQKFQTILNGVGLEQWTAEEFSVFLGRIAYDTEKGRIFPHPGLAIGCLWDRILKELNDPLAGQAWDELVAAVVLGTGRPELRPPVRAQLRRLLAEVLCNTPYRISGDFFKEQQHPEAKARLKAAIHGLWCLNEEHILSLLIQRGGFLVSLLGEADLFPQESLEESPASLSLLRTGLIRLAGLLVRGVGTVFSSVRWIVPLSGRQEVAVIGTNGLHLLAEDGRFWCQRWTKSWKELGLSGRLAAMIPLARDRWLLACHSGDFFWGRLDDESLGGQRCSLDDFTCYCGFRDEEKDAERVLLGGCDQDGHPVVMWCGEGSVEQQKGAWKKWFVLERGRIIAMCRTDHVLYAIDQVRCVVRRAGRFSNNDQFDSWCTLAAAPMALTTVKVGEHWLVLVGDRMGRLLAIREEELVGQGATQPILAWQRQFPSAIRNLGCVRKPALPENLDQPLLVVGTARDGTFLVDPFTGDIRSALRQTCPATAQAEIDPHRVLMGTVRGEIWLLEEGTAEEMPKKSPFSEGLFQEWIDHHQHHALGLALEQEPDPHRSVFFQKALDYVSARRVKQPAGQLSRTLPKTTPPVQRYLVMLAAHCLGLEGPEPSGNLVDEALARYVDWLAGEHHDVQVLALYQCRRALSQAEKSLSRLRIALFDQALARWAEQLLVGLSLLPTSVSEVAPGRLVAYREKFEHLLDLLLETMVLVAGHHGGRGCAKLLLDWERDFSQNLALSQHHQKFAVLLDRHLLDGSAEGCDGIRRMGISWDRLFRINQGNGQETLRQWRRARELWREPSGCPAFWPEPVWDLIDILHLSGSDLHSLSEAFSKWQNNFAKTANSVPDLKPWTPFIGLAGSLLPIELPTEVDVATMKRTFAQDNLVHPELGELVVTMQEQVKTYRAYLKKSDESYSALLDALTGIVSTLKTGKEMGGLTNLERRFVDLLGSSWQEESKRINKEINDSLPQLGRNQPERLVQLSLRSEQWTNDTGQLRVNVRNLWVRPLDLRSHGASPATCHLGALQQPGEGEEITISCNRQEISNEQYPCRFELIYDAGWEKVSVEAEIPVPLRANLKAWIREAEIDSVLAGELKEAVGKNRALLLQTTGERVPVWSLRKLVGILVTGHGYQSPDHPGGIPNAPMVRCLTPGEPYTLEVFWQLASGARWFPLELLPAEVRALKKQLLPFLHGSHVPCFSALATCLVLQVVEQQGIALPSALASLVLPAWRERAPKVWETVPEILRQRLPELAEDLVADSGWLFGLESDLPLGRLLGPEIWRLWVERDDLPDGVGLDAQSFSSIRSDIEKYWDWSCRLPPAGKAADILRRTCRIEKEEDLPGRWEVWSGTATLTRKEWRVVFFLPVAATDREAEAAEFWDAFLDAASKRQEQTLCFVLASDQGRTRQNRSTSGDLLWVDLGPDDLFALLTWYPNPMRLLAWRMSMRLPLGALDPFRSAHGLGSTVATMFHGRQVLLARLKREVFDSGGSFLISGARKIGKTSLLEKLRHDGGKGRATLSFDFQDVVIEERGKDAITLFCAEFTRACRARYSRTPPFTSLEEIEEWLTKRPASERPVLLLDELDKLFEKDLHEVPVGEAGLAYNRQRWSFPLFAWLRKHSKSQDGSESRPLLSMVMVSYAEGSSRPNSFNQWIERSGSPLYNWVEEIPLDPWSQDETRTFLPEALKDLGIFLTDDLLSLMADHSLGIPWLLQEMGKRLLQEMGAEPARVRWPNRREVLTVIVDTLAQARSIVRGDMVAAAGLIQQEVASELTALEKDRGKASLAEEQDKVGTEIRNKREKHKALEQVPMLLESFAADGSRFPDEEPGKAFTLDEFVRHLMADTAGKKIGARHAEQILDHLNRTVGFNGCGVRRYQFAFGLLPMVLRWQERLRGEGR